MYKNFPVERFVIVGLREVCNQFDLPFSEIFDKYIVNEIWKKVELLQLAMFRHIKMKEMGDLFPLGGPGTFLNACVIYSLIRYYKCKKILETGVSGGFYTSFILSAAMENFAEVDSVELSDDLSNVAKYVPYGGYDKWHLYTGCDSLDFLSKVENMDYDFYCHDSLHTKEHMLGELNYFKKTNNNNFCVFFDDQNDDGFWLSSLFDNKFSKEGYVYNFIDGDCTSLCGHLGGFINYKKI